MKSSIKFSVILVLGVFISLGSYSGPTLVYAYGEGYGQKNEEARGKFKKELFEALNLTPEQEEQMQKHREAQRAQRKSSFEGIKAKKDALQKALQEVNLDMSKVAQINAELKDLLNAMQDNRLAAILGVRDILTPEQFKGFLEFKEKHKGKWRKNKKGSSK